MNLYICIFSQCERSKACVFLDMQYKHPRLLMLMLPLLFFHLWGIEKELLLGYMSIGFVDNGSYSGWNCFLKFNFLFIYYVHFTKAS